MKTVMGILAEVKLPEVKNLGFLIWAPAIAFVVVVVLWVVWHFLEPQLVKWIRKKFGRK